MHQSCYNLELRLTAPILPWLCVSFLWSCAATCMHACVLFGGLISQCAFTMACHRLPYATHGTKHGLKAWVLSLVHFMFKSTPPGFFVKFQSHHPSLPLSAGFFLGKSSNPVGCTRCIENFKLIICLNSVSFTVLWNTNATGFHALFDNRNFSNLGKNALPHWCYETPDTFCNVSKSVLGVL